MRIMEIAAQKTMLRQQMNNLRDRLDPQRLSVAETRGEKLARILFEYCHPNKVGLYWPKGNEFPTRQCVEVLQGFGIQLALPVVEEDHLHFYRFDSWAELSPGPFGIAVPPREETRRVQPSELDAVIIPGVAFDRFRFRLGWGKGYYDRYLPLLSPYTVTVGLGYEFQLVDRLPVTSYDRPVQHLFTETGSTFEHTIRIQPEGE